MKNPSLQNSKSDDSNRIVYEFQSKDAYAPRDTNADFCYLNDRLVII